MKATFLFSMIDNYVQSDTFSLGLYVKQNIGCAENRTIVLCTAGTCVNGAKCEHRNYSGLVFPFVCTTQTAPKILNLMLEEKNSYYY